MTSCEENIDEENVTFLTYIIVKQGRKPNKLNNDHRNKTTHGSN